MNRRDFLSTHSGRSEHPEETLEPIEADQDHPASGERSASTPSGRKFLRTTTGLERFSGPWNAKAAAHLLRRTTFGHNRSDVNLLASSTLDTSMSALLANQQPPPPPIGPSGVTWLNGVYEPTNDGVYSSYLKAWWVGLMVNQGISLRERMVLFWHNHFPTEYVDVQDSRYLYRQNSLFRQYALGNIKQLMKAVTLDPAMLRYLNGYANRGDGRNVPDENFARELQELFTIGKGTQTVDPANPLNISYTTYTEADVKAAARVLTGWTDIPAGATATSYRNVNSATIGSSFLPTRHDSTPKTFSYTYGNRVIQGRTGADGALELDDLLDMIFSQKETARYLCRKLYRWFVFYDIDANAEQNVIAPLADILYANNYEVKPVLDTLLKSAHFFDDNNIGCVIKSPIDFVVGTIRRLGIVTPALSTTAYYRPFNDLRTRAANLQMNLLDPPGVAGWPAYYQTPDFYELWISTATLPLRGQFSDLLFSGLGGLTFDRIAYVSTMAIPSDPRELIEELAVDLFPIPLTQNQKDYLIYNVMGLARGGEYNWTDTWNAYHAPGGNTATNRNLVLKMLDPLLKFMLRLAEYQLA